MTTRRLLATLAVTAAVVSAGFIATQPAAAATDWTARDTTAVPPGDAPCVTDSENTEVCYQRNGDILWVKDGRRDGHHAEMVVHWFGGLPIGICNNYLGEAASWTRCDIDITPENHSIFFYARTSEGSRIIGTPSDEVITLP